MDFYLAISAGEQKKRKLNPVKLNPSAFTGYAVYSKPLETLNWGYNHIILMNILHQ